VHRLRCSRDWPLEREGRRGRSDRLDAREYDFVAVPHPHQRRQPSLQEALGVSFTEQQLAARLGDNVAASADHMKGKACDTPRARTGVLPTREVLAEDQRRRQRTISPEIAVVLEKAFARRLLESKCVAWVGALTVGETQEEPRQHHADAQSLQRLAELAPPIGRRLRPVFRVGARGKRTTARESWMSAYQERYAGRSCEPGQSFQERHIGFVFSERIAAHE
jgi:hypothetical protein